MQVVQRGWFSTETTKLAAEEYGAHSETSIPATRERQKITLQQESGLPL